MPTSGARRPARQRDIRSLLRRRLDRLVAGDWSGLLDDAYACQPHRFPSEAIPPADDSVAAHEFVRLGRSGQIGRPVARLASLGVAPASESVVAELRALVAPLGSASSPAVFDLSLPRAAIEVHAPALRRHLQRAAADSGTGPLGWRFGHLQLLLSDDGAFSALHKVVSLLACGELQPLASALAVSALVPLRKPNGRVRPLAIGDVLRRLTASTLCAQLRPDLAAWLSPDSLAVGVPSGTEVLAKAVRVRASERPTWAFGKIDGVNAYCNQPRDLCVAAVAEGCPALARFHASWYARVSRYVVTSPVGSGQFVYTCSGWDQGDALAPVGYSLVLRPAIAAARARIVNLVQEEVSAQDARDVLLANYLDDVILGTPASVFVRALAILRDCLAATGHFTEERKFVVCSPLGGLPEGLLADLAGGWCPDGLTVVGEPVSTASCTCSEAAFFGLADARVVGSDAFVARVVEAQLSATLQLARTCVSAARSVEPGHPGAQVAGLALHQAVHTRILHFFRSHYSVSLCNLASAFDVSFRAVAGDLWGIRGAWPSLAEQQFPLPLRLGGMGFHRLLGVAPAAYLGSWAGALPHVCALLRCGASGVLQQSHVAGRCCSRGALGFLARRRRL